MPLWAFLGCHYVSSFPRTNLRTSVVLCSSIRRLGTRCHVDDLPRTGITSPSGTGTLLQRRRRCLSLRVLRVRLVSGGRAMIAASVEPFHVLAACDCPQTTSCLRLLARSGHLFHQLLQQQLLDPTVDTVWSTRHPSERWSDRGSCTSIVLALVSSRYLSVPSTTSADSRYPLTTSSYRNKRRGVTEMRHKLVDTRTEQSQVK